MRLPRVFLKGGGGFGRLLGWAGLLSWAAGLASWAVGLGCWAGPGCWSGGLGWAAGLGCSLLAWAVGRVFFGPGCGLGNGQGLRPWQADGPLGWAAGLGCWAGLMCWSDGLACSPGLLHLAVGRVFGLGGGLGNERGLRARQAVGLLGWAAGRLISWPPF